MFCSMLNIVGTSTDLSLLQAKVVNPAIIPAGLRTSHNYCGTSIPFSLWFHSNEGTMFLLFLFPYSPGPMEIVFLLSLWQGLLYVYSMSAPLPRSSKAKGFCRCWLTDKGRFKNYISVTHGIHSSFRSRRV